MPAQTQINTFSTSMIHDITRLAKAHGAVNLGQGTPDDEQPFELRQANADAIMADKNKYTAVQGIPALLDAIAANRNREINPSVHYAPQDAIVTAGATEAFFITMQVLLQPGDELVTTDPYYGLYTGGLESAMGGQAKMARRLKTFPMKLVEQNGQQQFEFDLDAFEERLTDKTKVVALINPHNPTGATLNKKQLERIGRIIQNWEKRHPGKSITVISDETYEHIVFDGKQHVSAASVPSIRNRLILINTMSKSFNATGNRLGWLLLPPTPSNASQEQRQRKEALRQNLVAIRNSTSMCCPEPTQQMAVKALTSFTTDDNPQYYDELRQAYEERRNMTVDLLEKSPLTNYTVPQGSYFILVDVRDTLRRLRPEVRKELQITDSENFVKNLLIPHIKVAVVPGTGLFKNKAIGKRYVRVSFCQDPEKIRQAFRNLEKLNQYLAA